MKPMMSPVTCQQSLSALEDVLSVVGEEVMVGRELLWQVDFPPVVMLDGLGEVRIRAPRVPFGYSDGNVGIDCDEAAGEGFVVES